MPLSISSVVALAPLRAIVRAKSRIAGKQIDDKFSTRTGRELQLEERRHPRWRLVTGVIFSPAEKDTDLRAHGYRRRVSMEPA